MNTARKVIPFRRRPRAIEPAVPLAPGLRLPALPRRYSFTPALIGVAWCIALVAVVWRVLP
ncbi:MAG: hypothetical protein ACYCR3_11390 [Acidithiobacillus sp.]